jgi:hypothetical protein
MKVSHPKQESIACPQDERIERIERMQYGTTEMIKELSQKFHDAMFPSELHPSNGMINQVSELRKDINDVKEFQKTFKIWFAAGVFFISGFIGFIQWLFK